MTVNHILFFISGHPKKPRLSQLSLIYMICFTRCQTFQFRDANSANFLAAVTIFFQQQFIQVLLGHYGDKVSPNTGMHA